MSLRHRLQYLVSNTSLIQASSKQSESHVSNVKSWLHGSSIICCCFHTQYVISSQWKPHGAGFQNIMEVLANDVCIDVTWICRNFDPQTQLELLAVQPVSKAQARQRLGRAGREERWLLLNVTVCIGGASIGGCCCSGVCYRLFMEESFESLTEQTIPEIQRWLIVACQKYLTANSPLCVCVRHG